MLTIANLVTVINLELVKLSLCFNWAPRHGGVLGEWKYSSTHSLTSALDGGEWSASRPGRFTPRERAPRTHWTGGWMGPRAVLVKRKIPSPCRESNPRTPIIQPVAQLYTDWAIAALLELVVDKFILVGICNVVEFIHRNRPHVLRHHVDENIWTEAELLVLLENYWTGFNETWQRSVCGVGGGGYTESCKANLILVCTGLVVWRMPSIEIRCQNCGSPRISLAIMLDIVSC
jgi:hypothetical protein